jgi:hypothetical protein
MMTNIHSPSPDAARLPLPLGGGLGDEGASFPTKKPPSILCSTAFNVIAALYNINLNGSSKFRFTSCKNFAASAPSVTR